MAGRIPQSFLDDLLDRVDIHVEAPGQANGVGVWHTRVESHTRVLLDRLHDRRPAKGSRQVDRLAVDVDTAPGQVDARSRFQRDVHQQVLTRGDSAQRASGVIRQESFGRDLVAILRALERDTAETGADLAIILAILSSFRDRALDPPLALRAEGPAPAHRLGHLPRPLGCRQDGGGSPPG